MVMQEMDKPRDTFILARGDYRNQTREGRRRASRRAAAARRRTRRANRLGAGQVAGQSRAIR